MNEYSMIKINRVSYEVIKCPEGHKYIADGLDDEQKHLCEWMEWK